MKTLNEYLICSLYADELQIDEGLKDWIKKAAITTAMAASLLSPQIAKADIVYPKGNETLKEIAHKVQDNFVDETGEDCDVFISHEYSTKDTSFSKELCLQDAHKFLQKTNKDNKSIKSYKVFKSKDGKKMCMAFILSK